MSFVHMRFEGKTTSPWHVTERKYGDYLYTRNDYLWGRGVRGPILRQLWRTFCSKSDAYDRVKFRLEEDCPACVNVTSCPFHNLVGSDGEGEFKDRPHLIVTSLRFKCEPEPERVVLATLDEKHLGVVEERAPVFVEYLPEGTCFEFESILMAEGAEFADSFESAAKTSLQFLGWGGFCNEGFGRGIITGIERNGFESFCSRHVEPSATKIREIMQNDENLTFAISPMLILENDNRCVYRSIFDEGFYEEFCNCVNERHWQFFGSRPHVQDAVVEISGKARTVRIGAWSRVFGDRKIFEGIGNELTFRCSKQLGVEEARAFALLKYGVGRFKNQGFGSLRLAEDQK